MVVLARVMVELGFIVSYFVTEELNVWWLIFYISSLMHYLLLYLGQYGRVTDGRTDVVTVGQRPVTDVLTARTAAGVTAVREAWLVVTIGRLPTSDIKWDKRPRLKTVFEHVSVLNSQSVLRNDVTSYALARWVWDLFWNRVYLFLYSLGPRPAVTIRSFSRWFKRHEITGSVTGVGVVPFFTCYFCSMYFYSNQTTVEPRYYGHPGDWHKWS